MTAEPIELSDTTFDEFINSSDLPVLVDFWADWCVPCKMVAPVVEGIARDFPDKIATAKLDVDANPLTAAKHSVLNIPTLIVFDAGQEAQRIVGAMPREALLAKLRDFV